jgi:Uma2 family endonuclease
MLSIMEAAVASANPLAVLKPSAPPRRYTLEEYLRREERSVERHEYYNGCVVRVPGTGCPHNIITTNAMIAVKMASKVMPKKYIVCGSNQKVYLPELNFGLYPDAVVVCEKSLFWDDNQVLLINPILIVEVLSRSTAAYDRGEKFSEYETLASFQEYVLVDQNRCRVESRFREEPDLWRETIVEDMGASISLKSIGCSIALADVYEDVELAPPPERQSGA